MNKASEQKFEKPTIKKIMKTIYFKPREEVIDLIQNEYKYIAKMFQKVEHFELGESKDIGLDTLALTINLNDCREDIIDTKELLSKEEVLKNAYQHDDNFIIIPNLRKE